MLGRQNYCVVVRPGTLTTFQDSGRPGMAHLGVPRSGALDVVNFRLANRLVGNETANAVLETTYDGVALYFSSSALVAVTGALADVRVNGRIAEWAMPLYVPKGGTLDVGTAKAGLRCYVAVAGGFQVQPVLGSRSRDVLSGLGPPPLTEGQIVEIGPNSTRRPVVDFAPYLPIYSSTLISVHPGPRRNWLSKRGEQDLFSQSFQVLPQSNRIGLRLGGQRIEGLFDEELASEAVAWGAVELLPSGEIVVFLADHPTTGGYPVVGVIDETSAGLCAQLRSGETVTFTRSRLWRSTID
jgi:biotin-dependent carboxylase-like uncharacterized protein